MYKGIHRNIAEVQCLKKRMSCLSNAGVKRDATIEDCLQLSQLVGNSGGQAYWPASFLTSTRFCEMRSRFVIVVLNFSDTRENFELRQCLI